MKYIWIGIALILFFGCKKQENNIFGRDQLIIKDYLLRGSNIKLNYASRNFYNESAYNKIIAKNNDSINRENYFELAWNYFSINDIENFKKITDEVFLLSKQSKNKYHLANSNNLLGVYFETKSINDSAFYFYLKSEKIYKDINAESKLCSIYRNKALVQYYVNDYLNAEKSLVDALIIAKKHKLTYDIFKIYSSLGIISYDQNDFNKAKQFFVKAEKILNENSSLFDNNEIAFSHCNKGINYFSQGKTLNSIKEFKKALILPKLEIEYPDIYTRVLDNLAKSYLYNSSYNNSLSLLIKSEKTRKKYNIVFGQNFNRLYLSHYYAAVNDFPKANQYALEALAISKNFKAPKDQLLCLKQLIKINPEKALKYSSQYISLSDSMQNMERQTRNKFAKIAFETDEITKEKEEVEEQYFIVVWVCLAIFIIALLLFVIGKQLLKQKEFRLQQVQQKANEEIYNLLLAQQNKIDSARNNEKERISKDLHDGVLNRLASTRMNLDSLHNQPTSENVQKSKILIDGIQDVEKEIRNISHDLNKEVFAKSVSFVKVISAFMEDQFEATKTRNFLEFDSNINWDLLAGVVKIHLYRIVQEAVHNTNKHARAQSIIINFLAIEGGIKLEIFDDGVGFLLNKKKKGIGLQNIYSRTALCNGTVLLESQKGIGTTLKLFVPYQE